ncbi:hypothetical protein EZV62_001019 [Acer yangbiense]|uniref:F-box domain-containing protein n=1 Tax=Acer yangbiense TaxID=1000413 RepID=A0A5C7ISY7_9ROSI|nr:hypothetical protein EZV62_001019 [Acer yangbiense]
MKRTKQAPIFPDDIIFEILTRLPGKSLARFKCVCKSCHSLINQLKYDNDHKLMLSSDYTFQSADFEAFRIKAVQLEFPLKVGGHVDVLGFKVIGSCNGLLLVDYYKGFVIWNPWTGGHKRLSYNIRAFSYDYFGFGYDHSTDDYRIVRI